MTTHLILGGARSGKSSFAEQIAKHNEDSTHSQVYYLATAQSLDGEMSARITQHQQQRPSHWCLIESPFELASSITETLKQHKSNNARPITILVDCLTLWLTNCLCTADKSLWQQEKKALLTLLTKITQMPDVTLLLVSNEVGHGIVPMGELSREFVDQAGWLHQAIAAIANRVDFIMAGIPLSLKNEPLIAQDIKPEKLTRKESK